MKIDIDTKMIFIWQVNGALDGKKCIDVSAGTTVSFAVTERGECFSWGMGSNGQLGHNNDEEDAWEPGTMLGKQLEQRKVIHPILFRFLKHYLSQMA